MSFRSAFISSLIVAFATITGAVLPAGADAAALDPTGFHFTSSNYAVSEAGGYATITIERTDTSRQAEIRYTTLTGTAVVPYDYTPEKSEITFAPGQSSASFDVPIVNHEATTLDKTIKLALFGPSPIGMTNPHTAVLTIDNDYPSAASELDNPLDLPSAATMNDPLYDAQFFVDPESEAARAAQRDPRLDVIADQPGAGRFGKFSYQGAGMSVSDYLARASVQEPGTIPMLTTYRLVDGRCGRSSDTPADVRSYHQFASSLAEGIGTYRAVLFMEQDSLITTGCLSRHGLAVRMAELRYQIAQLKAHCPHLVVYLDAGAADAVGAKRIAHLLLRAGVQEIQGFFLDATHFDWTLKEIAYGEDISKLTGGKHFVVNTGESGQGPLVPRNRVKDGNEELCNPPGRGLGPRPSGDTGFQNVDAFVWIDNPGGSSGTCNGGPKGGSYWTKYALMLIKHANYTVRWGKVTSLVQAEHLEDAIIDHRR